MLRTHTSYHAERVAQFHIHHDQRENYTALRLRDNTDKGNWTYCTLFLRRDDVARLGDAIAAYLEANPEPAAKEAS
jgi:hypothetical protein